jgi:aspartate dehydrogenase
MKSAAIFGMGAIGTSLAMDWNAEPPLSWSLAAVCARPRQFQELRKVLGPNTQIVEELEDLLALFPDAVVEAAGQASAQSAACQILRNGSDLYLLSSGILANADVFDQVVRAAEEGNSSIVVPAGALAGFDGLATLRRMQPTEVTYRSTKPVQAWMGTQAEEQFDLAALTAKTVIFRGPAREAALAYPKNANLAATVALAGIGFDKTQVELIADPAASRNSAEIECRTSNCVLRVEMASMPETLNPKSSATVRSSILAALERSSSRVKLG